MPRLNKKSSNQRSTEARARMRLIREDEERRKAEQAKDTLAHQQVRTDNERRQLEQAINTVAHRKAREDPVRRHSERDADTEAHRKAREDDDRRKMEQVINTAAHQKAREDPVHRHEERQADAEAHRKAREDDDRRKMEQAIDTVARRARRQNEEFRTPERAADSASKKRKREDPNFREQERLRRKLFHDDYETLLAEYNKAIRQSPTVVCSCCGCLWYPTSTTSTSEEELIKRGVSREMMSQVLLTNLNDPYFCTTCKRNIYAPENKRKVPRLALSNGFDFPNIPEELKNLSPLEERLVALRIPFVQIRLRGPERQATISGNVVNVENDILECTQKIPRPFNKTGTVHIKLQRRKGDPRPYMEERIQPYKVYLAAKYLIQTELYKKEDVRICEDWQNHNPGDTIDFNSYDECTDGQNDEELPTTESIVGQASNNNQNVVTESSSVSRENMDPPNDEATGEDVNYGEPGCNESLLYLDKEVEYQGIKIAPGEGNTPIPFFRDKEAEEMSFPTIYCGQKRRYKTKVTYTDIAKSEIRRFDRRASTGTHLLYAFKKSLNEKVYNALQVCLRQRSSSNKVTAKNAKTPGYLQSLIEKDDGYAVFQNVRSSPCYWKKQQKKVNAMIRQVGKPQFFITLSAAETHWTELLQMLTKVVKKEDITEDETKALSFLEKADLIRKDPVTCMLHFDHRFRTLLNKLLNKSAGIFAPYELADYFARLEFQMRGSPHLHSCHWLKNAPTFIPGNIESEKAIIIFIDTFITCKRDEEGEMDELIGYQLHKHSHTCYKKNRKKKICRFGFPKPPLPETTILNPVDKNINSSFMEKYKINYDRIRDKLTEMGRSFKENVSFQDFLQSLALTKEEYILAVRSSIKRATVFLRRQTSEIFINNYNKKLLIAWRANIDVQYILDTYACTKYCVGYIMKSDGGVSKLLRAAEKEAESGNLTVYEKLKKFARVLCHGCEISTQEAAQFLLGLPNTYCSKQDVFINTNEPLHRIGFLKPQKEIEKLDDDSEDIYVKGMFDHYSNRPMELEGICLAEYASMYEKVGFRKPKKVNQPNDRADEEDSEEEGESELVETEKNEHPLALLDNSGYLKARRNRKIIRFRSYNKETDYSNYCRERLTLFKPWRNEQNELLNINCIEEFEKLKDLVQANSKPFFSITEDEEKAINEFLQEMNDEDDCETMLNVCQNEEGVREDEAAMFSGVIQKGRPRTEVERFRPPRLMDEDQYLKIMRSLNEKQRRFVLNVVHLYKTSSKPFYFFLSGGAGVGKSHVIYAIVQTVLRIDFREASECPELSPVVVCAPTGKAAFNVLGMTLHTTFRLPANQDQDWSDLTESKANTYRTLLRKTKLIIIDEISMVNTNQLHQIDRRLQQLFCNYEDFGGKSILVVGHMRQLSPIMARHVFLPSTQFPCVFHENLLWKKFDFYELEEIMRQRGQHEFCQGLNNMSEGLMTNSEVALFKGREISPTNQPTKNAIWLFYSNDECQEYNQTLHQTFETEGAWAVAHDMVKGEESQEKMAWMLKKAETFKASDAEGLPFQTHLQIGAEYFVSTNIDVSDGLFNGSTGTLRLIEYGTNTAGNRVPTQVWIDFHNTMVGTASRTKTKPYQESKNINLSWTLIKRHERSMNLGREYRGIELIRKQLPLVAANAMTIAKSQGSSLPCVVVTPSTRTKNGRTRAIKREELYVACSRATSLEGLYINGPFRKPNPPGKNDVVTKELENLKERPMKFTLTFLQDYSQNVTLFFMNVQSILKHYNDIKSDACPMSASILAFVEPHILEEDDISFDRFRFAHRTNSTNRHRSDGSVLLVNDNFDIPAVHEKTYNEDKGHCFCTYWKQNRITFIMTYRSPKCSMTAFKSLLENVLENHQGDIILFGDFNIDISKKNNESFINFMHQFNLQTKLDPNMSTTNDGTHIDCLFSNVPDLQGSIYETYFSHHRAICLIVPQRD